VRRGVSSDVGPSGVAGLAGLAGLAEAGGAPVRGARGERWGEGVNLPRFHGVGGVGAPL
jgi:hypothetical protein